ncbi:TRAP transporter small permease subunit [Thalassospira lucentensis]|uniref:TRAP transporter small permease protein n=1 Tax=Thalassospira lucentensis TaxID=168935 RepID=A0A358HWT9_9PROT|nr:TRAP transporter small permease [Thalassospira lucentensis]HBU99619.1 C4-dicarboxylate ABC transporter permease [Thalassospira lucentensis]HCW67644.1 C4-dicarboxylate ABC transporter permease [Thalassospira lucentensis]
MTNTLIAAIRRTNRIIALLVGLVLTGTVILIIAEIVLREVGISLGGAEEISGYVMAGVASWGMSYALTELAHVRIDLIRLRLQTRGRALLDLIAIVALAGVASLVAFQCWPVLEKTIERGSRANTALETPLWLPQTIWLSGWIWFAVSSCVLVILSLVLMMRRDFDQADALVGARSEVELET